MKIWAGVYAMSAAKEMHSFLVPVVCCTEYRVQTLDTEEEGFFCGSDCGTESLTVAT
jgi:hypothetical protein